MYVGAQDNAMVVQEGRGRGKWGTSTWRLTQAPPGRPGGDSKGRRVEGR